MNQVISRPFGEIDWTATHMISREYNLICNIYRIGSKNPNQDIAYVWVFGGDSKGRMEKSRKLQEEVRDVIKSRWHYRDVECRSGDKKLF